MDISGNAYVTGRTQGNFPTTPGAFQTTGGEGPFVTKLNPTGTSLVYSTFLGGGVSGRGIAVDNSGNAYVKGNTLGNLPTTPGVFQMTNKAATTSSNQAQFQRHRACTPRILGARITMSVGASRWTSLATPTLRDIPSSTDFPTTAGAFQTIDSLVNAQDGFVITRLTPAAPASSIPLILAAVVADVGFGIAVDRLRQRLRSTGYTSS